MNESFGTSRRTLNYYKNKSSNNKTDNQNDNNINDKSINEEDTKFFNNSINIIDNNQSFNFQNSSILITDRLDVSNVIKEIKEDEDFKINNIYNKIDYNTLDEDEKEIENQDLIIDGDNSDDLESFDMDISKNYFLISIINF
jgi:hypothetical protein